MKIAIASDHRGYHLKEKVISLLKAKGHEVVDDGPATDESVDYPDFAALVASKVSSGAVDRGILICGTGIGMAIAANKFPRVRAAACVDEVTAELSRRHNDLNVLCLSGDLLELAQHRAAGRNLDGHRIRRRPPQTPRRQDPRDGAGNSRKEMNSLGHKVLSIVAAFALMIGVCSAEPIQSASDSASSSALKPIEQAALQATVEKAAKDLLVPGAVVLLRTPQGEFGVNFGTTQLGKCNSAQRRHALPNRVQHQDDDGRDHPAIGAGRQTSLDDPVSKYVAGVPGGDEITISELLEMRSGLFNYTNAPEFAATNRQRPDQGLDAGRSARHCVQAPCRRETQHRV